MSYRIPFNKPAIVGEELAYVSDALASGHLGPGGPFTARCERLLEERFNARRVLLTTSCTTALDMAALLTGVAPGEEVILPAFTFSSTATAFARRGATLRFVDIRPDTLNLDHAQIAEQVGERTRVIVPVHYAGVSCDMETIGSAARAHSLTVVEDAAQGVNARFKGRYQGTIGDLGAFSFHESKNLTCGEGGALVVNDRALIERAEVMRTDGMRRLAGDWGDEWSEPGGSYALPELLAAFLLAQLERMDEITLARARLCARYREGLTPLVARGLLACPVVPDESAYNHHIFYVMASSAVARDALMAHLRRSGILAVFHYVPLHTSPMGLAAGYRQGMLPVTEDVSSRLLRLPLYHELQPFQVDEIVSEIGKFFGVPA